MQTTSAAGLGFQICKRKSNFFSSTQAGKLHRAELIQFLAGAVLLAYLACNFIIKAGFS